jgi:XTP/dITP diphosphohydrolase
MQDLDFLTQHDSATAILASPPPHPQSIVPTEKLRLCFATNNLNKIKEVSRTLPHCFELLSLTAIGCFVEPPENGVTLHENSLCKAKFIWDNYQVDCIADDTGLEVEALNGAPGVYSARYAGESRRDEANIKLLLQNLDGVTNRTAHFRTVITVILAGNVYQFEGSIRGQIALANAGHNGFGYDPIFIPEGHNRTFAQMNLEEKNTMSHRAKAVREMATFLGIITPVQC